MRYKKILILGNGGSGKSFLCRQLGLHFQVPVYHLDRYYWDSKGTAISTKAWEKIHNFLIGQDTWIIEGTQMKCLDSRLDAADCIVFLDMPTFYCVKGILKKHFFESDNIDFYPRNLIKNLKWILKFNKNIRQELLNKLSEINNKEIIYFKNRKEVNDYLAKLLTSKAEANPN